MKPALYPFLSLLFVARLALAQDMFVISDSEMQLLGMEINAVTRATENLGVQLPASVIPAPDSGSSLISMFSGVLSVWRIAAGAPVSAGDVVAEVRSMELMSAQRDYLTRLGMQRMAKQQLDRDTQLFNEGVIAESRLQQTENQFASAAVDLRASEQLLALAGMNGADLQALQAGNAVLGVMYLRAPADGVLAHRAAVVGDFIEANSMVGEVTPGSRPWVAMQVPARLSALVSGGVSFSSGSGKHELQWRSQDYVIDTRNQTFEILLQFTEPAALVPGQLLDVTIHPAADALLIPAGAVVHEKGQTLVYVHTPNQLQARPLDLVPVGEGYMAQSGIAAGEQIVVKGAALVKGMQLGLGQ